MDGTELLFIVWFALSVGCIILAWIKGGWIAGVIVSVAALIVGLMIGVIK